MIQEQLEERIVEKVSGITSQKDKRVLPPHKVVTQGEVKSTKSKSE